MDEIWKRVPETNSLEASSLGRLRGPKGIVKGTVNPDGYRTSATMFGDREKTYSFHRMVASAFHPKPNGMDEVNHIDGDKLNNRPDNLEWCTRSHNMLHSYRVLKRKPVVVTRPNTMGEKSHFSRVTEAQVRLIKVYPVGTTSTAIAKALGINRRTVNSIRLGQTWKHVTVTPYEPMGVEAVKTSTMP